MGENLTAAHQVKKGPRQKAERSVYRIPRHTHRQNKKENKLKVKSKRKPQREIYSY